MTPSAKPNCIASAFFSPEKKREQVPAPANTVRENAENFDEQELKREAPATAERRG